MCIKQSDLARELGVSQGTVSRALRGHPAISRDVRKRVLDAARKVGYELPRGELPSETVLPRQSGVICVDIPRTDEWQERLLDGILKVARESSHEIITAVHSRGDLPQVVTRSQVDGLIRLMYQGDYHQHGAIPEAPVPTVSILFPLPGADVISVDHFGSARDLGLRLGAANPGITAYVGHTEPIGRARFAGVRCGLEECGNVIPDELVRMSSTLDPGEVMKLVDELLQLRANGEPRHQFQLIAFYNDFLARHAVLRMRDHGLNVPRDIGVAGYDDLDLPIAPELRLATVHLPLEEIGAEAVRRLQVRMANPELPPLHFLLDTYVVDGNSTVPLPE